MPPAAKSAPQRKRTRKRKRRAASSSSSSSSSDSSEDEQPIPSAKSKKIEPVVAEAESTSSDSDSSESSSSSSEEEEIPALGKKGKVMQENIPKPARQDSRSPSPPPTALPSFLPTDTSSEAFKTQEQDKKERFRQFWMASVADGFQDDLEQIRKEPNLGKSRLALLIDSLASGADVFTGSQMNETNEMDMLLG